MVKRGCLLFPAGRIVTFIAGTSIDMCSRLTWWHVKLTCWRGHILRTATRKSTRNPHLPGVSTPTMTSTSSSMLHVWCCWILLFALSLHKIKSNIHQQSIYFFKIYFSSMFFLLYRYYFLTNNPRIYYKIYFACTSLWSLWSTRYPISYVMSY